MARKTPKKDTSEEKTTCARCGYEGKPETQTGPERCPVCHHPW